MSRPIPRRRGGPYASMAYDLLRAAAFHRRISLIPLLVIIALAALITYISFTAAPWVIYPGL